MNKTQTAQLIDSQPTEILITQEMLSLYEKQYSRQEVADEIGISTRTLSRYLVFGAQYIVDLQVYLDDSGFLNRRRFESSHLEYLREIHDLTRQFSKERVISILTRKYSSVEND
ncbi:hypothetical protein [Nostoc sp. WHI]|uniref:hypothetical protein n=1 Tax=Nostoc sp. WHI TaxID=2650611 RepID=UPI0018C52159|nr:hypothetical protein [Nostoc sp. WHI]MBG1265508.1 hypothetical protein [Nostoc sp. WHI]